MGGQIRTQIHVHVHKQPYKARIRLITGLFPLANHRSREEKKDISEFINNTTEKHRKLDKRNRSSYQH